MNRSTEDMSLQLGFIDFDQMPEDKVQYIKNMLNCPCSAVQLPYDLNFQPACDDSYAAREEDEYRGQEVEQHIENTVSYGMPVMPIVSSYPTHIQQAPLYAMANSNFMPNPNQIPHLLLMPDMMNPIDGHQLTDGSISQLKSGLDPGCGGNGPSGAVVVSSNTYHPQLRMFHYSVTGHHSPQYVMSHVRPAYISTYAPQPPPAVCKAPTMMATVELSVPSSSAIDFTDQRVLPVQSPSSMPMTASGGPVAPPTEHQLARAYREYEEVEGEEEEEEEEEEDEDDGARLEHVVVEVPPVCSRRLSNVQAPAVMMTTREEHLFIKNHEIGLRFLCADELEKPRPTTAVEECPAVESKSVDDASTCDNDVVEEAANCPLMPVVTEGEPVDGTLHENKSSVAEEVKKNPERKSWASLFKSEVSTTVAEATRSFPDTSAKNSRTASHPPIVQQQQQQQHHQQQRPITATVTPTDAVRPPSSREGTSSSKSQDNSFKVNNKRRETSKRRSALKATVVDENRCVIFELGKVLSAATLDHRHTGYMIRGLSNRGNWCYINSILQALLVCNPLYNLLDSLRMYSASGDMKTSSPIINSMVDFVKEFAMTSSSSSSSQQQKPLEGPSKQANKHDDSNRLIGLPFEPTCVYEMLSHLKLNAFEGRQEDAEEFLSCLLNGLHDELAKAMSCSSDAKTGNGNAAVANGIVEIHPDNDSADEDSWKVIEPHNKCSVTRSTSFSCSPLSDIFCGRIRSAVHSSSTSSAMLQPFFTLPLDVQSENVKTVANALHGFVTKESLVDYHCAKTKQEIAASRQITLEELPPVLILHLKRFVYCKDGGCMKVSKRVDFDVDLRLKKELLSPAVRAKTSENQRSYKLVAVVYHCGSEAAKGHYVTDVYHQGGNFWFRTDDSRVVCVPQTKVLNHPANFVPYLFFYQRMDTVQQKNSIVNK